MDRKNPRQAIIMEMLH